MVSRYTEKNKFGGYTWHIKLDSLFHIFIHETDNLSYVIEFKEWKWISYKTHFSFVSNENLNETIVNSFERVFGFLQKNKDYGWSKQKELDTIKKVLYLIEISQK